MRGLFICSTLLATRARFLDSDAFKASAHSLSALFCSTYFSQVALLPRPKLTEDFIQGAVPSREQVHASSGCRCSERSSSHAELSPLNFDGQDRDPFGLQWPPLVLWSLIISSCDTRVPTSDSAIENGVRMKVGFPCRGHTRTSYVLYRS